MGGNAKDIGIGIATGGLGGLAAFASDHGPSAPPALPVDPNLADEQQRAEKDKIAALTTEVQGDSASLMARYGTRLAIAGTSSSASPLTAPIAAAPAPPAATDSSFFGTMMPFAKFAAQNGIKF